MKGKKRFEPRDWGEPSKPRTATGERFGASVPQCFDQHVWDIETFFKMCEWNSWSLKTQYYPTAEYLVTPFYFFFSETTQPLTNQFRSWGGKFAFKNPPRSDVSMTLETSARKRNSRAMSIFKLVFFWWAGWTTTYSQGFYVKPCCKDSGTNQPTQDFMDDVTLGLFLSWPLMQFSGP